MARPQWCPGCGDAVHLCQRRSSCALRHAGRPTRLEHVHGLGHHRARAGHHPPVRQPAHGARVAQGRAALPRPQAPACGGHAARGALPGAAGAPPRARAAERRALAHDGQRAAQDPLASHQREQHQRHDPNRARPGRLAGGPGLHLNAHSMRTAPPRCRCANRAMLASVLDPNAPEPHPREPSLHEKDICIPSRCPT